MIQSHTPVSMDAPLDGLASMHFALIYIDEHGKVRFEASPSIANNCQTILAPNVTDSFLRAVALSDKGGESRHSSMDASGKSPMSPRSPAMHDGSDMSRRSSLFVDTF